MRWQIQKDNPEISKEILTRDMRRIEEAQPQIAAAYEKLGWSAEDARNASLVIWRMARHELKPHQTIDRESLIEAATGLGIMVFSSEPDQADVYIDSQKIGTTNSEKYLPLLYFPDGAKVTVRFSKPEFAPKDEECWAKAQDTVICKALLTRNQD